MKHLKQQRNTCNERSHRNIPAVSHHVVWTNSWLWILAIPNFNPTPTDEKIIRFSFGEFSSLAASRWIFPLWHRRPPTIMLRLLWLHSLLRQNLDSGQTPETHLMTDTWCWKCGPGREIITVIQRWSESLWAVNAEASSRSSSSTLLGLEFVQHSSF